MENYLGFYTILIAAIGFAGGWTMRGFGGRRVPLKGYGAPIHRFRSSKSIVAKIIKNYL
jgi:hypothetical protein